MSRCTKKNCPMNAKTLNPECDLKSCPYRTEISDDLITRQAVINAIANTCFWLLGDDLNKLMECINSIPSVTPQKLKGKWIHNNCSICGYGVRPWNNTPYCPNCGAKMEVEKC